MNEPLMTQEIFSAKWRERVSLPADLWLELLADVESWIAEDLSALVDTSNSLRRRARARSVMMKPPAAAVIYERN